MSEAAPDAVAKPPAAAAAEAPAAEAPKDEVLFLTEEEEQAMDIQEERAQTPLREDVGEAVGPDGKIDWDCPCLAGMTEGPCAPQFKEAFSCFVYSTEEPKGQDCIQFFEKMHECLVAHPEHYGTVEDAEEQDAGEQEAAGEPELPVEDSIIVIEEAAAPSSSESESESEAESDAAAEESDA